MISRRTLAAVAIALGLTVGVVTTTGAGQKADRYPMRGMVMKVSPSRHSFIVSHDSVPKLMDAMTMAFDVAEPKELEGVEPGTTVAFTLVVDAAGARAEGIRIERYQASEQDPLTAQRLALLNRMTRAQTDAPAPVKTGDAVPDFTLIDQARRTITLSAFRGKVVAVNFIYTSCALPQFCFRIANHFGVMERRFAAEVGRDLILLTVTFDPVRDTPEALAEYASQWTATPGTWHFLTGPVPDVKRVCDLFGVDFFPDEGLMNHSSHTAVLDRSGHLVANIEGNAYTAEQLGDLIATVLAR